MYGDRDGGYGGQRSFAPVQEGEELDVRIEAVGEKGDGIAKKKGFVLFVPNTKEGQEVRVRVTKVLRKVGFAEVIGDASGPVEDDSKSRPQERTAPPKPEKPAPEDSDNFGEDAPEASENTDSEDEYSEEKE